MIYPLLKDSDIECEADKVEWTSSHSRLNPWFELHFHYNEYDINVSVRFSASDATKSSASINPHTPSSSVIPIEDIWLQKLEDLNPNSDANRRLDHESLWDQIEEYMATEVQHGILKIGRLSEFLPYLVPEVVKPRPSFFSVLHDVLHPHKANLTFKTLNGIPRLVRSEPVEISPDDDFMTPLPGVPEYLTTEMLLSNRLNLFDSTLYECTVKVKDREEWLSCKLDDKDHQEPGHTRQDSVLYLHRVEAVFRDDPKPINIPKLRGFVRNPDTNTVIGYVHQFVVARNVYREAGWGHLNNIVRDTKDLSIERRTKWARQVKEIILRLHAAGMVWCWSLDQIAIDPSDNVWLTCFGYRANPMDWGLFPDRTPAGDLQFLEKLFEYLGVLRDESPDMD